ncbi:DNA primase [Paenibacillaceae bacterium]|nr:DNA primase [Paenibacillaceae bacterium]
MTGSMIPDEVIQAVLKHHDIVETVGRYVHLTKQGKYMKGLCPFHSEKTPSFTVTPEKQIFHCYGCGQGGDVIKFVAETEGYSFPEAVRVLAEDAGIPVTWTQQQTSPGSTAAQRERDTVQAAHEYAAKFYHYLLGNTEFGRTAKEYLRSRGLSDKLIEQFQIGFAPDRWDTLTNFLARRDYDLSLMEKGGLLSAKNDGSGYVDRFRNRIIFPLWSREGKVIAFAGRIMDDGQPKYLNSPETMLFNKGRSLYNFHQARPHIRKTGRLVLFEGYMDVIKSWEAGVHNGVATMGTALTEEHVEIIRRNAAEVIICYDGDDAGQAAALKTIPMLEKAKINSTVALLPQGMDPDEYITSRGGPAFTQGLLENAVSAMKFRLIYLKKSHKLEEEGRKNYLVEAVKMIAPLESGIEREFYLKELALEFDDISLDSLKQECNEIRNQLEKMKPARDNNAISWNNGMNEKRPSKMPPTVLPAYHKAERHLLYVMIQDAEVADTVYQKLGEAFVVEDHAALAAYLYAYYAQGNDPDVSRFIATLQDDRLERAAAAILMMDDNSPLDPQLLDRYIIVIQRERQLRTLERRKEEWVRAERSGDPLLAAQIFTEINALERQLKE